MKKKQYLIGFYRALGTGSAMLLGMIVMVIIGFLIGASIDVAGIKIN